MRMLSLLFLSQQAMCLRSVTESEETANEEACHSAYVVVNDRDSDDSEGSPPPRDESEATMKQRASAETNL